jgi:hypothetical protein
MTHRPARLLAALALTVLAVAGCSEEDAQDAVDRAAGKASSAIENADVPDVDWSKHSAELQDRLEKLAEDADCDGLQRELARVEGNDSELTRYLKAQLRKAGC